MTAQNHRSLYNSFFLLTLPISNVLHTNPPQGLIFIDFVINADTLLYNLLQSLVFLSPPNNSNECDIEI